MCVLKVVILCQFFCVGTIVGQNCKTRGEWCADDYHCCGGCCISNQCIDSYHDCSLMQDPCLTSYCPADAICRLYKPYCSGCEVEKRCIFLEPPVSISMDPSYNLSAASSLPLFFKRSIFAILYSVMIPKYIL